MPRIRRLSVMTLPSLMARCSSLISQYAPAIVEHLQDVLDSQIAEVETDPVAGVELIQFLQEFAGAQTQQPGTLCSLREEVRIGKRGVARRFQIQLHNGL
jgi:hypothetical protein